VLAEMTAREIGRVTITEALELTALVARKQPEGHGRFAARWVYLWLEEHEGDGRRCCAARLEPAIARDPKGPRLGARNPEDRRPAVMTSEAADRRGRRLRPSGRSADDQPELGQRHPLGSAEGVG
jgi:hypothetical protein